MPRSAAPANARRSPSRARLAAVFVTAVIAVAGVTFATLSVLVDSDDDPAPVSPTTTPLAATQPSPTAAEVASDGRPTTTVTTTSTPPATAMPEATASSASSPAPPVVPLTLEWETPCIDRGPALGAAAVPVGVAGPETAALGPLGSSPSLTVELPMLRRLVGHPNGPAGELVRPGVDAIAVAGGVVIVGDGGDEGRVDSTLVAFVGTAGDSHWIRCVPGTATVWNADSELLVRSGDPNGGVPVRWAWWSLDDASETRPLDMPEPSFFVADEKAGPFEVDRLDRWLLLHKNDVADPSTQGLARIDLVEQTVEQIPPPPDAPGVPGAQVFPGFELMDDGSVLQVASVATPARLWRDGAWLDDPPALSTVPRRVDFDATAGSALVGVDASGAIAWQRADLTRPTLEGAGIWLDGQTAVLQACTGRDASGTCPQHQLVGVNVATGQTLWAQPGFRVVAGRPANGSVIVSTPRDSGATDGFDGWKMIDIAAGETVSGQSWLGSDTFAVGCCGDGFYRHSTNTGGVVISVDSPRAHVWLPVALSVPTVTVSLLDD